METPRERLWTTSFLLLWQGQLVSVLGDVVYSIALGFWILAKTGSTGLMGALLAASTLPRILVSPIAGVVVDRSDRRRLLILMDVIRGAAVLAVAGAAIAGILQVWMVFAAGVLLGVCGAFFSPGANSVIPDITAKTKIVQANSVFSMIQTGGNIVGNSAGGVLYQALGAPLLFLFNGVSYLFSAFNLLFAKVPRIDRGTSRPPFLAELGSGFRFVWEFRGLRYLVMVAALINFFANMAIMLFLPFFQKDPTLGPARYGVAMAFFTGGMFLGVVLTAAVKIPASRRFALFIVCATVSMGLLMAFPYIGVFSLAVAALAVAGCTNAILNVFITSVVQITVPQDSRGRVFALMGMVLQGLTPIAFALGGIFAELLPLKPLISGCFALTMVGSLPLLFVSSFRRFIGFDPARDTLESVR